VLENQHKLHKFLQLLQQQQTRHCSSGRLQQAIQPEIEQDYPQVKTIDPSSSYYPVNQPFKHEPDVGDQFAHSQLSIRLAAPHQLNPKPDVEDLVFGKHFTDHMLKVAYHRRLGGWQNPEIQPMENLVLHPAAKVFHYAVELFEGMKAYRCVDGKIRMFRPDMNMARMNASARRSGLPTFEAREFIKCLKRLISIDQEWVPHTEAASLYIRPTLIGIEPTLGVASSDSALLYTILSPVGGYFKPGASAMGISLLADPQYVRAWPGGVGDRKVGSNYGPTIQIQKEATAQGINQILWLYGEDRQVTEAGTMNMFMLIVNEQGERELITPPLNGIILPGITRDSILHLAREWQQFKISERTFTMNDVQQLLYEGRLLEMFGAGTACIVSPIERILYMGENLMIPTLEHSKPVWKDILTTLSNIQYGAVKHPWAVEID
jgi:branched-chain amino acid aminotransferase